MTDPRLDRVPKWDRRNLEYPVAPLLTPSGPRVAREWAPPARPLDQGNEGACVGFGWAHELAGSPTRVRDVDNAYALSIYQGAKRVDEWAGENYDGTSVLAGAKTIATLGFMDEYRWAESTDDVIDTLVQHGPVVIGIDWFDGMYETRPSGLVDVSGPNVGGHCIYLYGYHPRMRISGEGWLARFEVVRWMNSWGDDYGNHGKGLVRVEDLEKLLGAQPEACIPVHRTNKVTR